MMSILLGVTLFLAVFTTVTYVMATLVPLLLAALIALVISIGLTIFLWYRRPLDRVSLVLCILLFGLFSLIAPKLLITRPDGLYTGIVNAYGDIAWHAANITAFAEGQTTPPENPIFAGTRLTYPFLTNFFSAILLKSGLSMPASVNLPALILIPLLLTLFYGFIREITASKLAAVIALLLFLFGGAVLGWTRFPKDWQESNVSLVEFLAHLPARDYSGVGTDEQGFHFLNPVTTLLLPQRSFLFALPLALTILLLLLPGQDPTPKRYLAAGLAAGVLPLFHAHTVLALVPVIVSFFLLDKNKKFWFWFLLPAVAIGLPEVFYYLRGQEESGSFLRWGPRWLSGERNIFWYWFINTGLLIPTTIIGLFMNINKSVKALAISGLLIFIAANLFLFAPWAWDNFKLFVYFFLFILPIVATVAARAIQQRTYPGLRAAVVIVIAFHILSAGLDMWKLALPTAREWQEWDRLGIEFAQAVKEKTQAGETIVTATNHNSPIVLAGRPRYLGFAAHVWSHGGDPWEREAAVKEFYEGRLEHAQLPDLQPNYIVVSPHERGAYPDLVIRPTWELVTQIGDYQLYKL